MKQLLSLITLLLVSWLTVSPLFAQKVFYDYRDAAGDWQVVQISNRLALVADSRGQAGSIDIELPRDGNYKIYAILMHRWNKAWPVIETEIVQNNRIVDTGYFMLEPGDLSHLDRGRWLVKSTDLGKTPYLQKGRAQLKFRLNSLKSIRKKVETGVEGNVYLWSFLVIPAEEDGTVQNLLEAERCSGDWSRVEYREEDRCGIIESAKGVPALFQVDIPRSGTYQLAGLLRDSGRTTLQMAVYQNKREDAEKIEIALEKDGLWRFQPLLTIHLEKGVHSFEMRNSTSNRLWIDSFVLVPHKPEPGRDRTLSCSTVYFYHNNGTKNLAEGIEKIGEAGFKAVDIVAYDSKYGFGDDVTLEEIFLVKKQLTRLGLKVASVHFGHIPLRTEEEALGRLRWAIWVAKALEAPRIVAPVSLDIEGDQGIFLSKEKGFKRLTRVIKLIRPELEQGGIELGLENHGHRQWLFQGIDDYLKIRTILSANVTFVPDEDHFAHFGDNPKTAFRQLLPYSRYVHFKSRKTSHIGALVKILEQYDYSGDISLEVEESSGALKDWLNIYKEAL